MADFDISSILNSLSPEDIENIKKAASGFLGNIGDMQGNNQESQKQENHRYHSGCARSDPRYRLSHVIYALWQSLLGYSRSGTGNHGDDR